MAGDYAAGIGGNITSEIVADVLSVHFDQDVGKIYRSTDFVTNLNASNVDMTIIEQNLKRNGLDFPGPLSVEKFYTVGALINYIETGGKAKKN